MLHLDLSERGYWVFPAFERRKGATYVGNRKWGSLMDEGDQALAHGHLIAATDATGWAICPAEEDPVPLLLLDIDSYGQSFEELWGLIEHGPPPEGLGVTRTTSGGFHLWFRLPPGINASKVPAEYDLGNGIKGEIRVSGPARRLLMLPGSQVVNKFEQASTYDEVRPIVPDDLPEPPQTLMARLMARSTERGTEHVPGTGPDGMATEAHHVIDVLSGAPIPTGERNVRVARIGQILGRIGPAPKPSEELLGKLWDRLGEALGDDFTEKEFRRAVASGYQTGRRNFDEYTPRDRHPTVTDVRTEAEAVFGGNVWLAEVRDGAGKTRSWVLGIGGSPKRREEAEKSAAIEAISQQSVLTTLSRLSGASPDSVVRSPLFIQPGWAKVLLHDLMTERAIDIIGISPEERFWNLIEDWARAAANDGLFLRNWSDKRPDSVPLLIHITPEGDPVAAIMPAYHDVLQARVGDYAIAKKLCKAHTQSKRLGGMRRGREAWTMPLEATKNDDLVAHIKTRYAQWLKKRKNIDEAESTPPAE